MAPRGVRMVRSLTGHREGGGAARRKAVVHGEATRAASAMQNGRHSCWAVLGMRKGARGGARVGEERDGRWRTTAACADAVGGVARRTKDARRVWAATGEVGRVKESRGRLNGAGWGKGVRRRGVERIGVA
jgi:hypothetical protein